MFDKRRLLHGFAIPARCKFFAEMIANERPQPKLIGNDNAGKKKTGGFPKQKSVQKT